MFLRRLMLPLTATCVALGCSGESAHCPGMCSDETAIPTMTIEADDRAASIASARVVSGPCTAILLQSEGEAGVPTSYARVQVTYHWPTDVPPLCIVELSSRSGQVESVAVQVKAKAYTQACCPYGTCCAKTQDALTQRYRMEFEQRTVTVSFPPPPDGGIRDDAADLDAADANDAPAKDDSQSADATDLDGDGLDVAPFDSSAADGGTPEVAPIDVADGFDLATDT